MPGGPRRVRSAEQPNIHCPVCGYRIWNVQPGLRQCPGCAAELLFESFPEYETLSDEALADFDGASEVQPYGCPWEETEELGYWKGFWKTVGETQKLTIRRFYECLNPEGSVGRALLYATIIRAFSIPAILTSLAMYPAMSTLRVVGVSEPGVLPALAVFAGTICAPLWLIGIASAMSFSLRVFGERPSGVAVLRVVCYGSTPYLFMALSPLLHIFLAFCSCGVIAWVGLVGYVVTCEATNWHEGLLAVCEVDSGKATIAVLCAVLFGPVMLLLFLAGFEFAFLALQSGGIL